MPFIPIAPRRGSIAASHRPSASPPSAAAAFTPVSRALTDGDTPAAELAFTPSAIPLACAPTPAFRFALTLSKYPTSAITFYIFIIFLELFKLMYIVFLD